MKNAYISPSRYSTAWKTTSVDAAKLLSDDTTDIEDIWVSDEVRRKIVEEEEEDNDTEEVDGLLEPKKSSSNIEYDSRILLAEAMQQKEVENHGRWGIVSVVVAVFCWVACSEILHYVFQVEEYNRPFLVTYVQTSTLAVFLCKPLYLYLKKRYYVRQGRAGVIPLRLIEREEKIEIVAGKTPREKISRRDTIKLALILAPLFLIVNYGTNFSLVLTSVSSNNIIFNVSVVFTAIFSWLLLGQGMGILRAACIFVSFGGVLLITWLDNGQTLTTMHGDYVVVITAFLYSLYVTLLKYLVPPNKGVDVYSLFGYLGLTVFIFAWPIAILLYKLGLDSEQNTSGFLPTHADVVLGILFSAVTHTLFNLLMGIGILLATPLTANVSLMLIVPLSILSDYLIADTTFPALYFIGTACILCGFAGMTIID